MIAAGIGLITFSIGSMVVHYGPSADIPFLGVVGGIILIIGLILLITSLIETWLTKGQTALVDGLQAG